MFEGTQIYNSIPKEITDIESPNLLKNKLKLYFLTNQ